MRAPALLLAALVAGMAGAAHARLPVDRAEIVRSYPHDPRAFTEGLFFKGGKLYESTGLEGQSDIREVRLSDGKVLRSVRIPSALFGEGIIDNGAELVSLTWRGGQGFRWTFPGLKPKGEFHYAGEGWGMTRMGRRIVMSDGTPVLRLLDPVTLAETGRIAVSAEGRPVVSLNELEYVNGEILANIWETDLIARIDPATGDVKGWIDVSGLPRPDPGTSHDAVPNGIAWDAAGKRLFVTGKNWPALYQIRLARPGLPKRGRRTSPLSSNASSSTAPVAK